MAVRNKEIYEFAGFRLDVQERTIRRIDGEKSGNLPDKTFEALVLLIRKPGHLVSKKELFNHIWPDTIVEENNLEKRIHALRQFFGKNDKGSKLIETVRGYGYRFAGHVDVIDADEPLPTNTIGGEAVAAARTNGKFSNNGHHQIDHSPTIVSTPSSLTTRSKRTPLAVAALSVLVIAAVVGYLSFVRSTPANAPSTLAILPAVSINSGERNELFEIGIAESLINSIASSAGLIVRPISSVREHAGSNVDPIAAGREQKADYVLAANYQISDGRIKVTGQLYHVASGKIEQTLQSEHDVSNVFAAQDAIAGQFAKKLLALFEVRQGPPGVGLGTQNEEAYRAYVQGMYLLDKRSPSSAKYLRTAVTLDPNYAQAWAGLALSHGHMADSRFSDDYSQAVDAIKKALAINPNQSEAYSAMCLIRYDLEWDFAGGEAACLRAIELNPASAVARQRYSVLLAARQRPDEAFAQLKVAIDLEPTSYLNQVFRANLLYFARRYDEAIIQYRGLIDLKPDRLATYNWFIRALEASGRKAEAYEVLIKSLSVEGKEKETIQRFRTAYEKGGYDNLLLERLNSLNRDSAFRKAGLYAQRGERDKAIEQLEEAYQKRSWQLAVIFPVEPQFDSLADDPRYKDIVKRVEGEITAVRKPAW